MAACVNCGRESKPRKQDSLWSWFICFCTTTCLSLTTGFAFALGVLLPVFMDFFNESRERTAWVSSITIGVFCFLGPVMGAVVQRFGCRPAIILGCLTCSVGLVLGSFAPSLVLLFLAFSLPFAVGTSSIYVSAPITVTHYFTRRRSVALGIVTAGQGLGTMVLGPVLRALVDAFDWRKTFCILAGVLALVSLSGCFLKPSSQDKSKNSSKKFSFNFSLLKNPTVLVLVAMAGLQTFSRMVPYVHLTKHCDDLGIPADKSSTLFLFIGGFAACGRITSGILCDVKRINSLHLLQAAVFVMGASTMLLTLAKTYNAVVAYAITFSMADGMMISTFIVQILKSVHEKKRASTLGFTMMSAGILSVGSPPLSGYMADKLGNYVAAFLVAGGVGVMCSFLPFVLRCFSDTKREEVNLEEIMDQGQQGQYDVTADKPRDQLLQSDVTVDAPQDQLLQSDVTVDTPRDQSLQSDHAGLALGGQHKMVRTLVRKKHQRPVSFMMAMETPFT